MKTKTTNEAQNPLLDMLGANTESRSFASAAEADKYIEELRNERTKHPPRIRNYRGKLC